MATPEGTRPDPRRSPDDVVAGLVSAFAARFGARPELLTRAPGRVNLIGEHVDHQGGLCLPMALTQATYAAGRVRDDGVVRVASLQDPAEFAAPLADLSPGDVPGWAAYAVGTLALLREAGVAVPGLDVLVDSTVPLGAGLSSSAALECSVGLLGGLAAGHTFGDTLRRAVVAAGIAAETTYAGAPTGGMDQTVSVFAQAGSALLLDVAAGTHTPVPAAVPGHTWLVIDTRVHHALDDGQYAVRRRQAEEAAATLGVPTLREATLAQVDRLDPLLRARAHHVVSEIDRVRAFLDALADGDAEGLGALLDASHASLRDDFEVSCPELDLTVLAARAGGAVGARMTGGGFGGSVVALVPDSRLYAVRATVDAAFREATLPEAAYVEAVPGEGAGSLGL